MAIATDRSADEVEQSYDGAGYGQFKADVAEAVEAMIGPVRERYLELRADEAHLLEVLSAGAERAHVHRRADARRDEAADGLRLISRRRGPRPRPAPRP